MRKDAVSELLEIDAATTEILGWTAEEMVGHRSLEFIHPDDQEPAIESWIEMMAAHGPGKPTRMRHKRRDGSWVWVEITNTNRLDDPEHEDMLAELVDISDAITPQEAEWLAKRSVRSRERLLDRIAEALPIGLCQVDRRRRVVYCNERLHEILGTQRAPTIDEQLSTVLRDDWGVLDTAIVGALHDGADADVEVQIQPSSDGRLRRCVARIRALEDDDGAPHGAIVTFEDVTESARMKAELERRANYDMLTRCHNRASVMSAVEVALSQGDDANIAVIFVDIDRFKAVNDNLGHAAGDDLLVAVADRIAAAIRDEDILGRIGGDEFLIVCSRIGGCHEALQIAERVNDALHGDVTLANAHVELSASVGVACSDLGARTADELVDQSDAAMYQAKREGAGRVVLFEPETNTRVVDSLR